jgi:hypothetical protein
VAIYTSKSNQDDMNNKVCCSLDSTTGFPSFTGVVGEYGYWMQPDASGCSGLLFSDYWVAVS